MEGGYDALACKLYIQTMKKKTIWLRADGPLLHHYGAGRNSNCIIWSKNTSEDENTRTCDFHCGALLDTVAGLHGLDECVYLNNASRPPECTVHKNVF